jgi:hypothetical protein
MQMNDNFENEIRRKLEGFSTEPPAHLWANIQAGIAPEERKRKPFVIWWLPLMFGVLVAGAAIIGNQVLNSDVQRSKAIVAVNEQTTSQNSNIATNTSANTSENAVSENQTAQVNGASNTDNANLNSNSSAGNNSAGNKGNAGSVSADDNSSKNVGKNKSNSNKGNKGVRTAYLVKAFDETDEPTNGPVKRFVKRLKEKKAAKRAKKNGITSSPNLATNANSATNEKELVAQPKPDAFVSETAPSFLNDTTPYIAKSDSLQKKEIQAALIEEAKAEEQKKNIRPIFYDFYVQPRLTYNAVVLQSNNELLALELLNSGNLTRLMGLDFGTRAVSFITPQWEFAYGFNFTYMKQDLSYKAQRLVKEEYQLQESVSENELRGVNIPVLTNRSIVNNLLLGGVTATTSLYLDKKQTLRLTTGMGFQMPLVYQMRVTENEQLISNEDRPRAGNGVPSIMFGGGFRTRLSDKASLILEPVATIYLRSTVAKTEPVRFKPYTVGVNAILRFNATRK